MVLAFLPIALVFAQATPAPLSMTINVQKLPAGFAQNPIVHVVFNEQGSVATCAVGTSSGNASIDKVACQQAQASVKMKVRRKQIPAPADVTIMFVEGPAPAK